MSRLGVYFGVRVHSNLDIDDPQRSIFVTKLLEIWHLTSRRALVSSSNVFRSAATMISIFSSHLVEPRTESSFPFGSNAKTSQRYLSLKCQPFVLLHLLEKTLRWAPLSRLRAFRAQPGEPGRREASSHNIGIFPTDCPSTMNSAGGYRSPYGSGTANPRWLRAGPVQIRKATYHPIRRCPCAKQTLVQRGGTSASSREVGYLSSGHCDGA